VQPPYVKLRGAERLDGGQADSGTCWVPPSPPRGRKARTRPCPVLGTGAGAGCAAHTAAAWPQASSQFYGSSPTYRSPRGTHSTEHAGVVSGLSVN